jgi:hypothetical protein
MLSATGGWENQNLMESAGLTPLPIIPDAHEAGITEPVDKFFDPLIVDIRPRKGSKNFYFYQNGFGQVRSYHIHTYTHTHIHTLSLQPSGLIVFVLLLIL